MRRKRLTVGRLLLRKWLIENNKSQAWLARELTKELASKGRKVSQVSVSRWLAEQTPTAVCLAGIEAITGISMRSWALFAVDDDRVETPSKEAS